MDYTLPQCPFCVVCLDTERDVDLDVSSFRFMRTEYSCGYTSDTLECSEQVPRPSRSIVMRFQTPHMLFSGIKVDQLKMASEMYKPYKGVKTASKATVEWRW